MTIGWPQGIMLFLLAMSFGMALAKHGEPKGNWSAGYSFFAVIINLGLLFWGGFFGRS